MPRSLFGVGNLFNKKKKRTLTYANKIWCWENNSHKCHICDKRVNKFSDAEFDHKRAYSKGGATNLSNVKIAHRQCNRIKHDKSTSEARKILGIKSKKVTRKKKPKQRKTSSMFPGLSMPRQGPIRIKVPK